MREVGEAGGGKQKASFPPSQTAGEFTRCPARGVCVQSRDGEQESHSLARVSVCAYMPKPRQMDFVRDADA